MAQFRGIRVRVTSGSATVYQMWRANGGLTAGPGTWVQGNAVTWSGGGGFYWSDNSSVIVFWHTSGSNPVPGSVITQGANQWTISSFPAENLSATAPVAAYPALFSTTGGTQGPIAAGDEFFIDGQTVGIVSSTIGSDSFNLTGAWGGPTLTDVEAVVNRDRTSVYGWPIPEQGSRMPFAILKESLRQIDAQVAAGGGGGGTPPTSFTPLTGQNGWNNVAGRMAAGYSYHSATASVELRGYLARTGTATPGEEIVNALPFGRRPSARFDVLGNGEPYSIETDGTIRFRGLGGITAPGDISLNGVIFRIA